MGHRRRGQAVLMVNRQVTVLRNFYRAMVALGNLEARDNPLAHFPKIKAVRRKLPEALSEPEVRRLIEQPKTDTIIGLRNRALLTLLYGTGIRASECSGQRECDIDWAGRSIQVVGKGGHERTIPLNDEAVAALQQYQQARGVVAAGEAFFRSQEGRALSRNAIYARRANTAPSTGRRPSGERLSNHHGRHGTHGRGTCDCAWAGLFRPPGNDG